MGGPRPTAASFATLARHFTPRAALRLRRRRRWACRARLSLAAAIGRRFATLSTTTPHPPTLKTHAVPALSWGRRRRVPVPRARWAAPLAARGAGLRPAVAARPAAAYGLAPAWPHSGPTTAGVRYAHVGRRLRPGLAAHSNAPNPRLAVGGSGGAGRPLRSQWVLAARPRPPRLPPTGPFGAGPAAYPARIARGCVRTVRPLRGRKGPPGPVTRGIPAAGTARPGLGRARTTSPVPGPVRSGPGLHGPPPCRKIPPVGACTRRTH